MNRDKKVLNIAIVVIFSLVLIIGALTMEVLRSYKSVRKMESEVAGIQQFVDTDKYVYFDFVIESEKLPDGIEDIYGKENLSSCVVKEINGELKLCTFLDEFNEDTKLAFDKKNIAWTFKELNTGNIIIDIKRDFSVKDLYYEDVFLKKFKIKLIDGYSLRIEYDNNIELVKAGDGLQGKFTCKIKGEDAEFSFVMNNYGLMRKSETIFNSYDRD